MMEGAMSRVKVAGLVVSVLAVLPLSATAATPSATCRSTDRPEHGMSGQTTLDEIDAGLPMQGFTCNTDLVGQYQGEGASWQLTAWKNCAYFDQRNPASANPNGSILTDAGVVVVDVSDPTNPRPTTWLIGNAMIDPWESVKVNPARQLLGGDRQGQDGFTVYDITTDCKAPVLKSDVHVPGSFGHTGQWAPDGKTYYVTPLRASPSIIAINVDDPTAPFAIPGGIFTFPLLDGGTPGPQDLAKSQLHDLEFSKDGNRAYITMFGVPANNGFAILDVSDFQQRRANPMYRVVGQTIWDDGSFGAQNALEVTIAGKLYVLVTDEGGGGAGVCAAGKSANGFPRLIDISDPAHPVVAAKIELGVADPANCTAISTAPITSTRLADGGVTTQPGVFAHSCHYCNVDNVDDARIAACNCFAAGLRFFDIHDVTNIKEMAYFKPPAQGTKALPGSQYANSSTPPTFVRSYDWATSKPSFPKDRGLDAGQGDVWTTAQDNGFMVVRLYSAVSLNPSTANVGTGRSQTFTATIDGAAKTAGVTWALQEKSGASVTDAGVFTSTAAGTYHVVATSIVDRTKSAAATVTVTDATGGGCTAAPGSFAGLLPLGALLSWLLWRRRTSA
jgi:uncharacterized protein (TIGR03382 family)